MRMIRPASLAVMGMVFGLALPAQAGVRFSLFGDLDSSSYSTGGSSSAGEPGFGGGLGLEIPLGAMTGLELGGVLLNRRNQIDASWVQIPVLYRLWLGEVLTLGVGGYYARGIGSATAGGVSESFASAGYTVDDFGLMGAVGLNIPLPSFSLMVEGRYGFGVYNVSAIQGTSATFNDFEILAGIRFGSF